jgi:hypothetical protein
MHLDTQDRHETAKSATKYGGGLGKCGGFALLGIRLDVFN